jgi:hypothetical protein
MTDTPIEVVLTCVHAQLCLSCTVKLWLQCCDFDDPLTVTFVDLHASLHVDGPAVCIIWGSL